MSDAVMIKTIYLKAKPETVWRYITKKDLLARWFQETDRDLTEKTSFQYLSHHEDEEDRKLMWGDVLEVDPLKKLVHTFTHPFLEGVITTVTWELQPADGATQLTMTHTGITTLDQLTGHDTGWDEHFMRLRSVVSW